MDIGVQAILFLHDDPHGFLAFTAPLGFEVRADAGSGQERWITVGPARRADFLLPAHRSACQPTGSM